MDSDGIPQLRPNEDLIEYLRPNAEPLWLWATTCNEPECDCRTALVVAAAQKEKLLELLDQTREGLDLEVSRTDLLPNSLPEGLIAFELNLDSGEVRGLGNQAGSSEPEILRIAKVLDGELLDLLARRWLLGKGFEDTTSTSIPVADLHDHQPGSLLAWEEVHPDARQDIYRLDGDYFEAIDTYCVRPACECNEVRLQFYRALSEDERAKEPEDPEGDYVGTVSVTLDDPVQIEQAPKPGEEARLDALMGAFRDRYPSWQARLTHRAERMADFGRALHDYLRERSPKRWVSSSRKRRPKPKS